MIVNALGVFDQLPTLLFDFLYAFLRKAAKARPIACIETSDVVDFLSPYTSIVKAHVRSRG